MSGLEHQFYINRIKCSKLVFGIHFSFLLKLVPYFGDCRMLLWRTTVQQFTFALIDFGNMCSSLPDNISLHLYFCSCVTQTH
uniref:Ovule protein n=1 Tax=Parascaris univalens TaxID=6257 RepID=A0A914ZPJ2_PARUN